MSIICYLSFVLAVLFVIIGLSLLILGHEAGHFFAAKIFGMRVDEFGFGFPPRIAARKKKETEYSLNWLPFGGFVKIAGENDRLGGDMEKLEALPEAEKKQLFFFQAAWRRFVVTAAGILVNFALGWFLLTLVFSIGTPPALLVSGVQAGSPAAAAGIREGDVILNYTRADSFVKFVNAHRGEPLAVEVKRDGKTLTVTAVPRSATKPGEGALGVLLAEAGVPRRSIGGAIGAGFRQSLDISRATLIAFYEVMRSLLINGALLPGVVGPVGIFSVAVQTGSVGFLYVVQLLAVISLNLAIINLIPFPALDGGRLLFIAIEKIKGSPIPHRAEALINGLGFVFLMVLIALITVRDVSRLFS